jgi:hypothetical protein
VATPPFCQAAEGAALHGCGMDACPSCNILPTKPGLWLVSLCGASVHLLRRVSRPGSRFWRIPKAE